jgi:nucleotide-binding universal stress UspA family protein
MQEIQRILVVSQFTQSCPRAVRYGLWLARQSGAEVAVLHLVEKNPFELSGGELPVDTIEHDYEPYLREAEQTLDAILASQGARRQDVKTLIRFGNPVNEIVTAVNQEKSDLLVCCSTGEGVVGHFVLDRAKDELIRKLPCSILLVKAGEGE